MHRQSAVRFAVGFLVLSTACAGARSQERPRELGEVVESMSDALWTVFHDSRGAHWFGSDGQGVYRADAQGLVRFSTADGLCNDRVRQIQEDAAGNVYIQTNGGISRFDGTSFTTLVPVEDPAFGEWKSEPGDLWFSAADGHGGPFRFDGTSLHRLEFPRIPLEDEFNAKFPNVPYSPYAIYTIRRDRRGAIWFGTACLGVCRFDGRTFTWFTDDQLTELDDGPSAGIRGIAEHADGTFSFSYLESRYDAYPDPATSGGAAFTKRPWFPTGERSGPPDGYFMSAVTDDEGATWMASYGAGVWRHDGERFTHYPVLEEGRPITLVSILLDRDGVLWLGTQAAGAWRFDGERFVRFRP